MALFTSNYPHFQPGRVGLLSIPERMRAVSHLTGRGVVIAFVDSGFYAHPDLDGRITMHVDATDQHILESLVFDPSDLSWHGQMTSVIAAGDGRSSGGRYRGIASSAELVLIKVSNQRGQIKEADIQRGLDWLVTHHERYNVRVVNLSVGGDFISNYPNHPLYVAVEKLTQAGVVVVAASGNMGSGQVVPPASAPHAITVGGLDDHNTLDESQWGMYHSNYGVAYDGSIKPDIIAPAVWIPSPILPGSSVAREARWLGPLLQMPDRTKAGRLLKKGYADLGITRSRAITLDDNVMAMVQARINTHKIVDAHYQHVDGTSVAAPIVTSIIAQMLEANPALTPARIKEILYAGARPLNEIPAERQGKGVIDASSAVMAAYGAA